MYMLKIYSDKGTYYEEFDSFKMAKIHMGKVGDGWEVILFEQVENI